MSDNTGPTLQLDFRGRVYEDINRGMRLAAKEFEDFWSGEVKAVRGAMLDYLNHVAKILVERNSRPYPGGTTPTSLSARTGRGVASILKSVEVKGTTWETLSGKIGGRSTLLIHESGGVIKAGAKLLTVPLPAALNSRGIAPRYSKQWKNTFVATSKAGNLIIFQKKAGRIVPLYVLKSSIYIRPRLGMAKELEEQMPYFIGRTADLVMRDMLLKMGG